MRTCPSTLGARQSRIVLVGVIAWLACSSLSGSWHGRPRVAHRRADVAPLFAGEVDLEARAWLKCAGKILKSVGNQHMDFCLEPW